MKDIILFVCIFSFCLACYLTSEGFSKRLDAIEDKLDKLIKDKNET